MRLSSGFNTHLSRLAFNFDLLKKKAPHNSVLFMVKANAYGHGLLPITQFAHQCGVRSFGCATLVEAITLRRNLHLLSSDIYVFSELALEHEQSKAYVELGILPVISNVQDLKIFLERHEFQALPLVLKFNVGMNRLGIEMEELEEVSRLLRLKNKSIYHLLGHFSSSYLSYKEGNATDRQLQAFQKIKSELRSSGISIERTSLANSGAIEQGIGLEESFIRPGLMLYGPASCEKLSSPWEGKLISHLYTSVLKKVSLKKGTPVGYGNTPLSEDGTLLTLALGYADGISTFYQGAKFQIDNYEAKFFGRINMDMSFLFFANTEVPWERGDSLTVWDGDAKPLLSLAQQLKTSPYQLLTWITERVPRHIYNK